MKLAFPLLLAAMNVAMGSVAYADELTPPAGEESVTDMASVDGTSGVEMNADDSAWATEPAPVNAASSLPPFDNGHFYLGGRLGWTAYEDACGSDAEYCDNDTLGYGLYGGYQFNDWLALEGGVTSYGSPESRYAAGKVEADIYGTEVAVKLGYPLTERMEVFTRLGGAWQRIDKDFSQMPDSIESSEWNILSSLGLSYRISQRWSLRGEYQFIDGVGDADVDQADQHFTSVGLTYHFGQPEPVIVEEEPAPVVVPPPVETVRTPISLSAESLFGFDSSEIKNGTSLDLLAQQLRDYPNDTIRIIGYTDSSGAEAYNMKLSERRAQSVADYLAQQGIDASRLTVIGMGENGPIASNDTAEGRAQNRRVEVLFDTTIEETQAVTEPSVEE
ncbi:OmpA family protein [Vibrio alginolyticus]|uniref:OmpA family protein n=1 Tax=Vibrio alginolyticus TaxID=663 RepID=UPI00211A651B|nr:OmpA family protein [Vibrio alginolyticus]MCQ9091135.1 OmpA family protein [Vibrio alginolyticus]